jgi:hypothetical protein
LQILHDKPIKHNKENMKKIIFAILPAVALFASCANDGGAPSQAELDAKVKARVDAAIDQAKTDCDARIIQSSQLRADSIIGARNAPKPQPAVVPVEKPAAPAKAAAPAPAKPASKPVAKPAPPAKPAAPKPTSNTNRPGSNQSQNTKPASNTSRPGSNQAKDENTKPASNTSRPGSNQAKAEEKAAPVSNTSRPGANK